MYDKCSDCEYTNYDNYVQKVENQQKVFMKYLEDKMNLYKINTQGYSMNLIEEILQKYKSIIGVLDENPKN